MTARPHIVVADGYTANPGDLNWEPLSALGELTVYDRSGGQLVEHCRQAQIVVANKERFTPEVLQQLPKLRFISVLATGTNVVDLAAASEQGIIVSNVPSYSTLSVAQHVFALLLALDHRVAEHSRAATRGDWTQSGDFSFRLGPIHELAGTTLGILGLGAIGSAVARIGSAFGMRVCAAGRTAQPSANLERLLAQDVTVDWVDVESLFRRADVLTLHCPLTPATQRLVNAERLAWMKPSARLINTGRGDLIDEAALAQALEQGQIEGAGIDVLSQEPPALAHPLLAHPRCYVTPHLAWATVEARQRLLQVTVDNVAAFLQGRPQNVVEAH